MEIQESAKVVYQVFAPKNRTVLYEDPYRLADAREERAR